MLSRNTVQRRSAIPQLLEVLPPDSEPLGIRDYLNYSNLKLQIQSDILAQKLVSARVSIENWTGRALITRTMDQIVDYDPQDNPTGIPLYMTGAVGEINLRSPPVRKITQVTVYDPFRVPTVVDPEVYLPLFITDPYTKLIVTLGHVWPGILSDVQAIRITCICGYATKITSVDINADTITAPGHPYSENDIVRLTMAYGDGVTTPSVPGGLAIRKNYYAVNISGDTFQLSLTSGGSAENITSSGSGVLFAGEIPAPLLRAIMITATADFLQDEYNKTGEDDIAIPQAARDLVRTYKRSWL